MGLIVGFVVVLAMVFGGYTLAGGKFDVILYALPFEGMMIGGAAIGSFVIANSGMIMKKSLKGVGTVMKGATWKGQDYTDLLCLLSELSKLYKQKGPIGIEPHIENYKESEIFQRYPKILKDHFAVDLICDSFRMITLDMNDPYQIEDLIAKQIKKHHHEALAPAGAIQTMSDGLPAIGIVAAVLGVIKTMSSIDQPPVILGKMIGGALVGTFLGVFLSYCLVGPIASRLNQIIDEDGAFYNVIKDVIVSLMHGYSPVVAIETGRGSVPSKMQPTFYELEMAMKELPAPK